MGQSHSSQQRASTLPSTSHQTSTPNRHTQLNKQEQGASRARTLSSTRDDDEITPIPPPVSRLAGQRASSSERPVAGSRFSEDSADQINHLTKQADKRRHRRSQISRFFTPHRQSWTPADSSASPTVPVRSLTSDQPEPPLSSSQTEDLRVDTMPHPASQDDQLSPLPSSPTTLAARPRKRSGLSRFIDNRRRSWTPGSSPVVTHEKGIGNVKPPANTQSVAESVALPSLLHLDENNATPSSLPSTRTGEPSIPSRFGAPFAALAALPRRRSRTPRPNSMYAAPPAPPRPPLPQNDALPPQARRIDPMSRNSWTPSSIQRPTRPVSPSLMPPTVETDRQPSLNTIEPDAPTPDKGKNKEDSVDPDAPLPSVNSIDDRPGSPSSDPFREERLAAQRAVLESRQESLRELLREARALAQATGADSTSHSPSDRGPRSRESTASEMGPTSDRDHERRPTIPSGYISRDTLPSSEAQNGHTESHPPSATEQRPATTALPAFPAIPAGTTMIVQGLVQTSDTLPPSHSARPLPSSSLQRRFSGRRSSELRNPDRRQSTSSQSSTPSSLLDSFRGADTSPSSSMNASHAHSTPREESSSASSIETLGMLLSVATAATAASLIAGSTTHQLASGLGSGLSNLASSLTPSTPFPSTRPSGSPQTTMPGGIANNASRFPYPRAPTPGVPNDPSPTSSPVPPTANREPSPSRSLLSAIRGRLFNRSSHTSNSNTRTSPQPPINRTSTPPVPPSNEDELSTNERNQVEALRENIASELARALLARRMGEVDGTDAGRARLSRPTTSTESSVPPLLSTNEPPVPGSFERFLHDIQIDLRTTLTERYNADLARLNPPPVPQPAVSSTAPASSALDASADTPINPHDTTDVEQQQTSQPSEADVPPIPMHRQAHRPSVDVPLNWWRMYRFPPRQVASIPTATSPTSAAPSTQPSPPYPNMPSMSTSPISPTEPSTSTTPSTMPSTTDPLAAPQNTIIPVIVVGLRSASTNNDDSPIDPPPSSAPAPSRPSSFLAPDSNLTAATGMSDDLEDSFDQDSDRPPWSARGLASRLSGLSRRQEREESERLERERTRARDRVRSYVIWVIGGYYPPGHPMLTSPNIVLGQFDHDDFWALAELLGQVKPPVASKEDIEQSGLEIIKSDILSSYEKEGKVTSNTAERCLICLSDYEPEEDLRIMLCRHAFHKDCVDRWLETGNNNCPACRQKGVPTQGATPQTSPTEPTRSTSNTTD